MGHFVFEETVGNFWELSLSQQVLSAVVFDIFIVLLSLGWGLGHGEFL